MSRRKLQLIPQPRRNPALSSRKPTPRGPKRIWGRCGAKRFTRCDAGKTMRCHRELYLHSGQGAKPFGTQFPEKKKKKMIAVLITLVANKQPYHSEPETNAFPSSISATAIPSWPHYGAKSTPQAPQIILDEKLDASLYLSVWCCRRISLATTAYRWIFVFPNFSGCERTLNRADCSRQASDCNLCNKATHLHLRLYLAWSHSWLKVRHAAHANTSRWLSRCEVQILERRPLATPACHFITR